MNDQHESSKQTFGGFAVIGSFVLGVGIWSGSHSMVGLVWLLLMCSSTCGMWFLGEPVRRERDELEADRRRKQNKTNYEMEKLEACLSRQDRREKIKKGFVEDDGLSEYGRAIRVDPELSARIKRDEEMFGSKFPDELEDLPALAAHDTTVIAAWKKKLKAEDAWQKIVQD